MTPPRMTMIWNVLEAAKDNDDQRVIAACRRLIVANRRGWKLHRDPADMAIVRSFYH